MNIIRTEGAEELIVLTRAEYDALIARAQAHAPAAAVGGDEDDDDEEAWLAGLYDEAKAAIAQGDEVQLPPPVWDALRAEGASRLRVLRQHRGLSQLDLAHKAGVAQPYLSQVESGKKPGSVRAMNKLAGALDVPLGVLVGE